MHLLSALTKKLGFDLFGNYSYQLTSEQSVKADYMLGTLLEKQDVNKRGNADRKAFPCENGGRHCEKTQNARVFLAFLFIAAAVFSQPKIMHEKSTLRVQSACYSFFIVYP